MNSHYTYIHAMKVTPPKRFGNRYLYEASCICGFRLQAYGRQLTEVEMMGHHKTMEWLKANGK